MLTEMTTHQKKYGDFPKPTYSPVNMSKVQFHSFCQCRRLDHTVSKKKPSKCDVSCFYCIAAVARSFQYKNCQSGMILFRGGKDHPSEVCTFRRDGTANDRLTRMKNLLRMAQGLCDYYTKKENSKKEGAMMFSNQSSILTSIRILALLQHYSPDVNNILNKGSTDQKSFIATPMLDVTRDVRIAASFAMENHVNEKRVVRLLLAPPTSSFIASDDQTHMVNFGTQVQRMGDTKMLLIELTAILPASALRPWIQSGYLIVYENDLINFHKVRLEGVELDNVMELEAARLLVNDDDKWDALQQCTKLDVFIANEVSEKEFFHELPGEAKSAFPGLSKAQLYPDFDPMKDVLMAIATSIQNEIVSQETHTSSKKRKIR